MTAPTAEAVGLLADLQTCFDQRISCASASPCASVTAGETVYIEIATLPAELLHRTIRALSAVPDGLGSSLRDTQPGSADSNSPARKPGLWRNLGLSRLERVKAHRDEFGSSLKDALSAVDEDYGRQVADGRAQIADAASDMLAALRLVSASTEWSCMERDTQSAVEHALSKATAAGSVGIGAADEPKPVPTGDAEGAVVVPRDQLETLRRSLELNNLLPGEGESLINCWIMASETEAKA